MNPRRCPPVRVVFVLPTDSLDSSLDPPTWEARSTTRRTPTLPVELLIPVFELLVLPLDLARPDSSSRYRTLRRLSLVSKLWAAAAQHLLGRELHFSHGDEQMTAWLRSPFSRTPPGTLVLHEQSWWETEEPPPEHHWTAETILAVIRRCGRARRFSCNHSLNGVVKAGGGDWLSRHLAKIDTLGLSSPFRSAYPYPLPSSITSLVLHATETAAFRQDLATQLIGNARAGHLARLVDLAVSDEAGLLSLLPLAPQLRSLRLPEPIVAPSVVDPPINTWSLYSAFLPACSGLTSLNIDRLSTSLSFQFLPPNIVRLRVASFSPARRGGRSQKRARCRSVSSLFSPSTSTRRRSTVCPSCWTVAFASSRCLHRFCAIMPSFQCYSAGENTAGFPFLPSPSKLTTVYKERSERRRSGRIRSHYRATLRSSPTAKSTLGISPLPPSLLLHLTPHFLSPMASAPESDSTTDPFDLLTVDDYTDKLVEAVERDEVEQVLFWSKQLKQNRAGGERSKINQPHSSKSATALIAACSKEATRSRKLVVRILLLSGATLPNVEVPSSHHLIRPWAREIVELGAGFGQDVTEAQQLLAMHPIEQKQWIADNLETVERSSSVAAWERAMQEAAAQVGKDGDTRVYVPPRTSSAFGIQPFSTPPSRRSSRQPSLGPAFSTLRSTRRRSRSVSTTAPPPNGLIDLSEEPDSPTPSPAPRSRSPSPLLELKEEDLDRLFLSSPAYRNLRKRTASPSIEPFPRRYCTPAVQAHVRVDGLPLGTDDRALLELFAETPGVIDGHVYVVEDGPWGLVTLASVECALLGFEQKDRQQLNGSEIHLRVFVPDADGGLTELTPGVDAPFDPGPLAGGGGEELEGGGEGGEVEVERRRRAPLPPQAQAFGRLDGERPFVTPMLTAAEMRRRLYVGSLPLGTTREEVTAMFERPHGAGVSVMKVAKVEDVKTHCYAIIQLADSKNATEAIQALHGRIYHGHLLLVQPSNELFHRWRFSLAIHSLPYIWSYLDVSDYLISTISSFAGLIVTPVLQPEPHLKVRVELRYVTEVKWAAQELNGQVVHGRVLSVEIEQASIRREMEEDLRRAQQLDNIKRMIESSGDGGFGGVVGGGAGGGGAVSRGGAGGTPFRAFALNPGGPATPRTYTSPLVQSGRRAIATPSPSPSPVGGSRRKDKGKGKAREEAVVGAGGGPFFDAFSPTWRIQR